MSKIGGVVAAAAAGGTIAGYDRPALSTYSWIAQGMIAIILAFPRADIAERVRTGDIAIDLGRPVHPVLAWLAEDVGQAAWAAALVAGAAVVLGRGTRRLVVQGG